MESASPTTVRDSVCRSVPATYRHHWDRQTDVFGPLLGRVAPLGWGNLGAALLDPFEQGAGAAFDLVVAARNRDG